MDPILLPFWLVVGVATMMISTSIVLARKIKTIKKSKVAEQEHETKITDLSSRTASLQGDLEQTKKDFRNAQNEINDLKDIEARLNTELRKTRESLVASRQEYDKLLREHTEQKESFSRQEKELRQALASNSKLENSLKKLKDSNQEMTVKIQELESSSCQLQKTEVSHQETIYRQGQELEQLKAQRSELEELLRAKEQDLHKLQNNNRGMTIKIQELQAQAEGLSHKNEAGQQTITHQQQELEQILAQRLELRNTLREREQQIQKLEDANQDMTTKIQELESGLQELKKIKESSQETLSRQQQELEQLTIQRSELNDKLKELEDANQRMTIKIEELESQLKAVNVDNAADQELLGRQQQELEQALSENSKLQDDLQAKEKQLHKLQEVLKSTQDEFKKLESDKQELEKTKESNQENILRLQQGLKEAHIQNSELKNTLKEQEQEIEKLEAKERATSIKLKESEDLNERLAREVDAQKVVISELKKESEVRKAPSPEEESAAEVKEKLESERQEIEENLAKGLLDAGLITETTYKRASTFQKKQEGNLLQLLFVNRDIDDHKLVEYISSKFQIPYFPLGKYDILEEALDLFTPALVQVYWVLPVEKVGDNLMVVMVDPFDNQAIKAIEKLTLSTVKTYVGLFSEMAGKIQSFYKINIRGRDAEGNLVCPLFIKTNAYKGRERRSVVRFKAEIDLRVADETSVVLSKGEDISWDGLSFKSEREYPPNSILTLQLNMKEGEAGNRLFIPAVTEVIHSTATVKNQFIVGAKFLNIAEKEIKAIIEYSSKGREAQSKLEKESESGPAEQVEWQ
ncbi:MAG: hypothetical protein DRP74_02870 [Candidatus Omnitrophota bacterium]|nr:MAG: hypothetical protein DRP74_02870 [Candidatus Omnitrophota bacterium]